MSRISARIIGRKLGKSAHEVNLLLEKAGFITKSNLVSYPSGSPTWDITSLGEMHGEPSNNSYSTGYIWDEDVTEILRDLIKQL